MRPPISLLMISTLIAYTASPLALPGYHQSWAGLPKSKFYESAQKAIEAQNYGKAIIQLKNALKEDPDDIKVRMALGEMYMEINDFVAAEKEFRHAMKLFPSDNAEIQLGKALLAQGNIEAMLRSVSEKGLTDKTSAAKQLLYARAKLMKNDSQKAHQHLTQSLKLDPKNLEALYLQADIALSKDKKEEAKLILQTILKQDPYYIDALLMKGEIAMEAGKSYMADAIFARALKKDPRNVDIFMARIRNYLLLGDVENAKKNVDILLENYPDFAMSRYMLASVLFAQGQYKQASDEFMKVQDRIRFLPSTSLLGALIKYSQGNYTQAQDYILRFLEDKPDNVDAQRALLMINRKLENPSDIIPQFQTFLNKHPGDRVAMYQLAGSYLAAGQYQDAADLYSQLRNMDDSQAVERIAVMAEEMLCADKSKCDWEVNGKILLAFDLVQDEDIKQAEQVLRDLHHDHSDNPTVLSFYGDVLQLREKYDQARQMYLNALKQDAELVTAYDGLEKLDAIQDQEPVNWIEAVLEVNPKSVQAAFYMASYYVQSQQPDKAINFLRQRLQAGADPVYLNKALFEIYIQEKQDKLAEKSIDAMVASAKDDVTVLRYAVNAYMQFDDWGKAIALAEEIKQSSEYSVTDGSILAAMYEQTQNDTQAASLYKEMMMTWPEEVFVYENAIAYYNAKSDFETALSIAERMQTINLDKGRLVQADIYNAAKNYDKQIIVLQDLLHNAKADMSEAQQLAVLRLYDVYINTNQSEQAFLLIEKMSGLLPGNVEIRSVYGASLIAREQYGMASEVLMKTLQDEPDNPMLLNNIAWLRDKAKQLDAIDYAAAAWKYAPQIPEIMDTYGWLLTKNGHVKKGLELLKRARYELPDSLEVQFHYAYALFRSGKYQKSLALLQDVLQSADEDFVDRANVKKLLNFIKTRHGNG